MWTGPLVALLFQSALALAAALVARRTKPLALALGTAAFLSGYEVAGAAYRVLGFEPPRLHVAPLASLSVGELWGVRWARPVSTWLRETCFRRLARRGHLMVGLLLGFVVSAIGHAYPVFVATSLPMAAMMFAFFSCRASS